MLGRIEVSTEYAPQSRFCIQKFGASSQTSHASAIAYLHGAGERGNELLMVTRFGLPAMLAEGRAVTTCTAYRCERHASCSARSQRRPGAGNAQHGRVRAGAWAGSRKLGPHGAVMSIVVFEFIARKSCYKPTHRHTPWPMEKRIEGQTR